MRPAFASHKKTNPSEKRLGLFFASHGTLTEEQVKTETARCLGCGAVEVAEDKFGKILPNRVKRAARTASGPGGFCATIGIYIFVAICLATYTPLAEA